MHSCQSSTGEVEAGVQDKLSLHGELQATLDYMRPFLKMGVKRKGVRREERMAGTGEDQESSQVLSHVL